MRRFSSLCLAVVVTAFGGNARGGLLTTFEGSLQPTTPASGWSYLWNSGGAIGVPTNYSPLLATTDPSIFYDETGSNNLPGPPPGRYIYFGGAGAGMGGHPGEGSGAGGSGGIERFAIAAYTLDIGGPISITDSSLSNLNQSNDGLDLRVYVNSDPTPLFSGSTAPGLGSTLAFDTDLGILNPGDTIYVAIGAGATDTNDTFGLKYAITAAAVPEPAGLAMLGTGMIGLVGGAMRRRRAARA